MPQRGVFLLGGIGCFLLAWAGLELAILVRAPVLWLPDALLIFLLLGRSGRTFAANLATCAIGILLASFLAAPSIAFGALVAGASLCHGALACWLMGRFAPHAHRLRTARALAHLLVWCALLSPMAGAAVMAAAWLDVGGWRQAAQQFAVWWIAGAAGTSVLLPFLLAMAQATRPDPQSMASRWREALLVAVLIAVIAAAGGVRTGGLLLALPLMLWSALRLDFRMTALIGVILAVLPIVGASAEGWIRYGFPVNPGVSAWDLQAHLLIVLPALFAALQAKEQRARQAGPPALRAVIDAVPLAIVTSTPDGKVGLWSRGAERMFGWRRARVEGAEPPFVAPDQAAHDAALRRRVLSGNEIDALPAQRHDQAGTVRDLRISASPQRDADGAITGIISVIEDVTDRRRLEASREQEHAWLSVMLDAVEDPIFISDEAGTIINSNRAAEAAFGYSAPELIGRNLTMLMEAPDPDEIDASRRRAGDPSTPRISRVAARRKDGSTFPVEITGSDARLDGRRVLASIVRSRSARTASSQPSDSDLVRFLSRITHDLRQPLHALSLMTGALERRVTDSESREIADDLSRLVRSIEATFENMAEWARLESGMVGAASGVVAAGDIIGELAREAGPEAARRNLALRSVRTRATIACDPALVRRLLRQLLDNAVKFTARGKVLLGARRRGSMLRLMVADTGSGIPDRQRAFVFEPYSQLDPGRETGGAGLGLAIARRLAEIAGLTIGFRSVAGKGSVFWIDVPLAGPRN